MYRVLMAAAALLIAALVVSESRSNQHETEDPNDWLLHAASDTERFKLIQNEFRGIDLTMREVGERYAHMHEALTRENLALAEYHWRKIRNALNHGMVRRPEKREQITGLFLEPVWAKVSADLKSGDIRRGWQGFEQAKGACQACHAADKVAFLNAQPLFDLKAPDTSKP